uniref:Uncharacterized protein n=1 Tax=Arundo donax TaxID=35708 RepID=A0A0A9FPE2_ARUDO
MKGHLLTMSPPGMKKILSDEKGSRIKHQQENKIAMLKLVI